MGLKIIGMILIISTCGGFGFQLAANHRREERGLQELVQILCYMECELQYRLTPLPMLCRQAAAEGKGALRHIFLEFSRALEDQLSPDVRACMERVLNSANGLPPETREMLSLLGSSLGRFDMEGQLMGLEQVRQVCRSRLSALGEDRDVRLRNYQTLGLCAGAALAILLI